MRECLPVNSIDYTLIACYTVGMEQIDGRSLDHRTLEHLRRLAVRRVESGEKPSTVVRSLGFCRTTIYRWLRTYRRRYVRNHL